MLSCLGLDAGNEATLSSSLVEFRWRGQQDKDVIQYVTAAEAGSPLTVQSLYSTSFSTPGVSVIGNLLHSALLPLDGLLLYVFLSC